MKFPGVLKKESVKFQESVKKEVEFPGVFNKKSYGISMGLGFLPSYSQGTSHNYAEIQGVQACFIQNF